MPKPTADALKLACRGAEGGVKKNVLLPAGEEHVLLLEALGQRVMGASVTAVNFPLSFYKICPGSRRAGFRRCGGE